MTEAEAAEGARGSVADGAAGAAVEPPEEGREQVAVTFDRTIEEGHSRLTRAALPLLATGAVGGVDMAFGVVALLLVHAATHNTLMAAVAFGIGFVALTLAGSELFTENFLVPLAAVAARRARVRQVARLWAGTLVTNLLAGWVMMGITIAALPQLRAPALGIAGHYAAESVGVQSFASAVLGGALITLMTWMHHSTRSDMARLAAAVAAAFVLAAGSLNHVIVVSLEMFAGLHAGAGFGYGRWALMAAWFALGNIVGGVGLVTMLRLAQVGPEKIREKRAEV